MRRSRDEEVWTRRNDRGSGRLSWAAAKYEVLFATARVSVPTWRDIALPRALDSADIEFVISMCGGS